MLERSCSSLTFPHTYNEKNWCQVLTNYNRPILWHNSFEIDPSRKNFLIQKKKFESNFIKSGTGSESDFDFICDFASPVCSQQQKVLIEFFFSTCLFYKYTYVMCTIESVSVPTFDQLHSLFSFVLFRSVYVRLYLCTEDLRKIYFFF